LQQSSMSLRTLATLPEGGPMPSAAIQSRDLQTGDVVDCGGHLHRVTHVDCLVGWMWPIAFDDAGWAMALGPDLVVVQRAGAQLPLESGGG